MFQEASSVVSTTNQGCYDQVPNPCFSVFGFEYRPGNAAAGGYITWINDNKPAWTLNAAGMAADDVVKISERIIPAEPLVSPRVVNTPSLGQLMQTRRL